MVDRPLSQGKIAALKLLNEAFDDAKETKRNLSDFAISNDSLRQAGATETDLRWLIAKRFAEQIIEAPPDESGRTFRAAAGLQIVQGGCFVLTYPGKLIAERLANGAPVEQPQRRRSNQPTHSQSAVAASSDSHRAGIRVRVRWDALRHALWVGGKLAKRFIHAAPLQWLILDRFEDDEWKGPVAVSLSGESKRDLAQRMRELVKELNHGLDQSLIKFRKDPSGPSRITFDVQAV